MSNALHLVPQEDQPRVKMQELLKDEEFDTFVVIGQNGNAITVIGNCDVAERVFLMERVKLAMLSGVMDDE